MTPTRSEVEARLRQSIADDKPEFHRHLVIFDALTLSAPNAENYRQPQTPTTGINAIIGKMPDMPEEPRPVESSPLAELEKRWEAMRNFTDSTRTDVPDDSPNGARWMVLECSVEHERSAAREVVEKLKADAIRVDQITINALVDRDRLDERVKELEHLTTALHFDYPTWTKLCAEKDREIARLVAQNDELAKGTEGLIAELEKARMK